MAVTLEPNVPFPAVVGASLAIRRSSFASASQGAQHSYEEVEELKAMTHRRLPYRGRDDHAVANQSAEMPL